MTMDASESPIDDDGCSTSELDVTQTLSLPDSFDESLCLDLYKECKSLRLPASASPTPSPRGHNAGEPPDITSQHNGLEAKVRELLAANLELKEKGRLYDNLKRRSTQQEAELEELRAQVQHQAVREKMLQHQVLEHKRNAHIMGIDLEHARKESDASLNRAEKAEADHEAVASALKSAEQKCADALSRLEAEREERKAEREERKAENARELATQREHQNKAFARESKLLCDARDQALEQAKQLHQELNGLRNERDAKENVREEVERQLADARSDLKVKSCESATLKVHADKLTEENARHRDEVARLQTEIAKLQLQTGKLQEVIRQKDEALESSDLLFGCAGNDAFLSPGSRSLVKSSVGLAKKVRELQAILKKKSDELARLHEQNGVLAKKEESNRRLFKELTDRNSKNASAYIVSAVNARDGEIMKLNSKVHSLQLELRELVRQRDELSSRLSLVLERRQQLDEMRVLVERMRHAHSNTAPRPAGCFLGHAADDYDSEDDLESHIVHHKHS